MFSFLCFFFSPLCEKKVWKKFHIVNKTFFIGNSWMCTIYQKIMVHLTDLLLKFKKFLWNIFFLLFVIGERFTVTLSLSLYVSMAASKSERSAQSGFQLFNVTNLLVYNFVRLPFFKGINVCFVAGPLSFDTNAQCQRLFGEIKRVWWKI